MSRSWPSLTDAELLRRADCEPDAFAELYLRHEAVVAGYLRRQTRDPELTADLTAETFATALTSAARFRGDGPAVGWLLGIARNHHLHLLRRGRAELRATERLGVERAVLSDASVDRIERLLDASDPKNPVLLALGGLSDDQRAAVVGFVLREQPYAELAAAFDVPEATVRQRVSRGLTRLRASIEGGRS